MKKKILIVEDNREIAKNLSLLLNSSGYESIYLEDFEDVPKSILKEKPDLVLLDINIPYMNGEKVLEVVRETSQVPIIMVTSQNAESDEVLSMSYGADDYITKPYNPNILLLRIGAVLRRTGKKSDLTYREIEVNLQKGILKRGDKEVVLTKNEMIIFNYLLENKGRIVSRDELMTDLWNNEEYINDNALSVNISRLRSKLKELGIPNAIETRKGLGYILS